VPAAVVGVIAIVGILVVASTMGWLPSGSK
jgi:hypothetical protein